MLAPQSHLEVRSRLPARATRKPPLIFVHGGYGDAWCWEPYFLPWFAAKGWPAYALSLRGHGTSSGIETLFMTTNPLYSFLRSSLVREIAKYGGDVSGLVPATVLKRLLASTKPS